MAQAKTQSKTGRKTSNPGTASTGPKRANQTGVRGSAVASAVLLFAESLVEQRNTESKSRKDILTELVLLDHDSHVQFRKDLEDRMEIMRNSAAAVKQTIREYREENPKANSIAVEVPMWKRLSSACELGWSPDMSKGWDALKQDATDKLNSQAASKRQADLIQTRAKIASDTALPEEVKAAKLTELDYEIEQSAVAVGPTARGAGRPRMTALQKAQKYLQANLTATADLEALETWLGAFIAAQKAAQAKLAEVKAKSAQPQGYTAPAKSRKQAREHAAASK